MCCALMRALHIYTFYVWGLCTCTCARALTPAISHTRTHIRIYTKRRRQIQKMKCMLALARAHTHTHTHMYLSVCIYVCIYVCMCECVYMYEKMCMWTWGTCINAYIYIYIHTYVRTYIHVYIHLYIFACSHIEFLNVWVYLCALCLSVQCKLHVRVNKLHICMYVYVHARAHMYLYLRAHKVHLHACRPCTWVWWHMFVVVCKSINTHVRQRVASALHTHICLCIYKHVRTCMRVIAVSTHVR
jgi:hypothetical protein